MNQNDPDDLHQWLNGHPRDARDDPVAMMDVLASLGVGPAEARTLVEEVYSLPRVTDHARRNAHLHVKGGTAFDLRINDEIGQPWDFSKKDQRDRCR